MAKADFYSKTNPHGIYGARRTRPYQQKTEDGTEGFSTPANLEKWAAYSRRGSENNPEQVKPIKERRK